MKLMSVIAASYGGGFGLPLIEAAQHKLSIIARDIPVFREVAGEHAFYFNATEPEQLSQSLEQWLDLYANNRHPRSDAMPWMTWEQSETQLIGLLGMQLQSTIHQQ
jgi:glycosyltransferase involved in cell wall biosynthesis